MINLNIRVVLVLILFAVYCLDTSYTQDSSEVSHPIKEETGKKMEEGRKTLEGFRNPLAAFRIDHNRYPEHLYQLTTPIAYFKIIPKDPFDLSNDLRYKALDNGNRCSVYSIGADGRDDGGDPAKDVVFDMDEKSKGNWPEISPEENQRRWEENERALTIEALEKAKASIKDNIGIVVPSEEVVLARLEAKRFAKGYSICREMSLHESMQNILLPEVLNKNIFIDQDISPRSIKFAQLFYREGLTDLSDIVEAFRLKYRTFTATVKVVWIPLEAAERLPEPVGPVFANERKVLNININLKFISGYIDFEIYADPKLKDYQLPYGKQIGMKSDKYIIENQVMDRIEFLITLSQWWNVPLTSNNYTLQCVYVYDPEAVKEDIVDERIKRIQENLIKTRESLVNDLAKVGTNAYPNLSKKN